MAQTNTVIKKNNMESVCFFFFLNTRNIINESDQNDTKEQLGGVYPPSMYSWAQNELNGP